MLPTSSTRILTLIRPHPHPPNKISAHTDTIPSTTKDLKMFLSRFEAQLFFTSVALGVLSHLSYFIHGEQNNNANAIFRVITRGVFVPLAIALTTNGTASRRLLRGLIPSLGFLVGLGSSIVVYRVYFHRLRKFPGPRFDAISKWGAAYVAYLSRRYFARLEALHIIYGDYVRSGMCLFSLFLSS